MEQKLEQSQVNTSKFSRWLKKVGFAGFLFFLIKGLAWIGVAVWAGTCTL
jgi:hypothetical protein